LAIAGNCWQLMALLIFIKMPVVMGAIMNQMKRHTVLKVVWV